MQNTDRYYQESGSLNANGALATVAATVLSAAVLGLLYGIISFVNPLIYVNFLGAIFMGIGIALVIGKVGYWGKVRNSKVIMVTGLLAGIVSLYAAWVGWLFALTEFGMWILNPVDMLSLMEVLSIEGIYEIFGFAPTGGTLYAIWGVEAVIILGGTFLNAQGSVGRQPYCEECEDWTNEQILLQSLTPVSNRSSFISALERHDFQPLMGLEVTSNVREHRTRVSVHRCSGCSGSKYLSVDAVQLKWDDDGKPSEEVNPIVDNLILSSSEYADLLEWQKKMLTVAPATAEENE